MILVKKISIAVAVAILVVGCADSKPVFTSNGQRGHSIDCSGELGTWGECYEEAGKVCGTKGYRVLEKMGDKESSIFGSEDILTGTSTNTRSLIIQCK